MPNQSPHKFRSIFILLLVSLIVTGCTAVTPVSNTNTIVTNISNVNTNSSVINTNTSNENKNTNEVANDNTIVSNNNFNANTTVSAPAPTLTNTEAPNGTYENVDGKEVPRPYEADTKPAGATAQCKDGEYSFSQHRQGTCSGHGGVAEWY